MWVNGKRFNFYSDNSGVLFVGTGINYRSIESQIKLSADDIATDLEKISREGLANNAQVDLIKFTSKSHKAEEISKEQL